MGFKKKINKKKSTAAKKGWATRRKNAKKTAKKVKKTQKKAGKRITKSVLDMMRKQKNVFDKVSRTV
jgi:hypothetical protein